MKPSTTFTRIAPDGAVSEIKPAGSKWTLAELRAAIGGGYIELVRTQGHGVAVVDEDGLLKGLPANPAASARAGRPLVGIVLFGDRRAIS